MSNISHLTIENAAPVADLTMNMQALPLPPPSLSLNPKHAPVFPVREMILLQRNKQTNKPGTFYLYGAIGRRIEIVKPHPESKSAVHF